MQFEDKPWFNKWPTNIPKTIKYPNIPLHGILKKTAKEFPQKVAIVYDGKEITYAQLDLLSNQFAHELIKLGVKKGTEQPFSFPMFHNSSLLISE